jgi:hypothetical protein
MATDSVIKPLTKKIKSINDNYDSIVQGLSVGDPKANEAIKELVKSVKSIFADFESALSQMKYGVRMSPGLFPNVGLVAAMIVYFIQEIIAAVSLFTELLKLISNIANLRTVLDWFYNDIAKAQQALSLSKLHAERMLNRTKQKVEKNIEWEKTKITININEKYSKQKQGYYQKQLESIQQAQTQTVTPPDTSKMTSGDIMAYNLQQEKNKQLQINQYAESQVLQNQLTELTTEVSSYDLQRKALDDDKTYWHQRWDTEAKQDTKFFNMSPQINANAEA